jgi:hypothetical protein
MYMGSYLEKSTTDIIKDLQMKSSWVFLGAGACIKFNDKYPYKKRRSPRERKKTAEKRSCEDSNQSGVSASQGTPWLLAAIRSQGERQGCDSEPPEGINPADTLFSDFWPPELGERSNLFCVKPPCFFQDILQAPGIREILFCY